MPTIGDVYNPLVEAAVADNPQAIEMLRAVGEEIFKQNPDLCHSVDDGIEAAKRNLDYYCQYFADEVTSKVKSVYELGPGYRDLLNRKHAFR